MATGSDTMRPDDTSNQPAVTNLQKEMQVLTEKAKQLLTDKLLLESEIS